MADVFLEVEPAMDTPAYPRAQVTVSVRLYCQPRLKLSETSLAAPRPARAKVIRIGRDRRYRRRRRDVVYQVVERRYAIFPEDGGELTIPPLLFQAVGIDDNRHFHPDGSFFDRFPLPVRRLRIRSRELRLVLTPVPAAYTGKIWLPARALAIREDKTLPRELEVGKPLTRTIRIEALGLMAEQLPEIGGEAPPGCRVYCDRPELENQVNNGNYLRAVKRQALAYLPLRAGTLTLPAVVIDWWDVVRNRQRKALLPARKIKVVARPGSPGGSGSQGDISAAKASTAGKMPDSGRGPGKPALPAKPVVPPRLAAVRAWPLVGAVLLLAWLAAVWCWRQAVRRMGAGREKRERATVALSVTAARRRVKNSCLANDPRLTQRAILAWAATAWPENPPTNLQKLAAELRNAGLV
ncbi:MAG: BatD family protein, partial [Deltaproteobacteria bacterium]|nr:BatD family protein [Deltaproteobacteria bacterium]